MDTQRNKLFSDNLNHLLENSRKPNGTHYTLKEVVDSAPRILTHENLWRLYIGKASQPSYQIVKALADFFGISPDSFFQKNEESAAPDCLQQKELSNLIVRRVSNLDPQTQKTILLIIDIMLKSKS